MCQVLSLCLWSDFIRLCSSAGETLYPYFPSNLALNCVYCSHFGSLSYVGTQTIFLFQGHWDADHRRQWQSVVSNWGLAHGIVPLQVTAAEKVPETNCWLWGVSYDFYSGGSLFEVWVDYFLTNVRPVSQNAVDCCLLLCCNLPSMWVQEQRHLCGCIGFDKICSRLSYWIN